jgi:hypothetical protein
MEVEVPSPTATQAVPFHSTEFPATDMLVPLVGARHPVKPVGSNDTKIELLTSLPTATHAVPFHFTL